MVVQKKQAKLCASPVKIGFNAVLLHHDLAYIAVGDDDVQTTLQAVDLYA